MKRLGPILVHLMRRPMCPCARHQHSWHHQSPQLFGYSSLWVQARGGISTGTRTSTWCESQPTDISAQTSTNNLPAAETTELEVKKALAQDDFDFLANLLQRPNQSDFTDIQIEPEIPQAFTLAPYVNQSRVLQAFLALGVKLYKFDKLKGVSKYLLSLDFEQHVKSHLQFLHDIGVPGDELGGVITKNPLIFKEHLDDLKVRLNYFIWKRFSSEAISRILSHSPAILSMSTEEIDGVLGFYQNSFKLSGDDVRFVMTKYPRLIILPIDKVKRVLFSIIDEFGFTEKQMKELLLQAPKIFAKDRLQLRDKFHYLHNLMCLSHETLVAQPHVFYARLHIITQRHEFLTAVSRAQYDPTRENYVSLKALVSGDNDTFCETVAKLPAHVFRDFLKTI